MALRASSGETACPTGEPDELADAVTPERIDARPTGPSGVTWPAAPIPAPRNRSGSEPAELSQCEFALIFDRYFAEIHGYVARRLGADAADDIAAETFETAFRKRGQYDAARGSVRAWLYGITVRQLARYRRSEVRRYRAIQRSWAAADAESHEEQIADRVTAQAGRCELAGALAALAPGDREVLLLVALGELTHHEISYALGIPYGTVGSRLNRVRRKLRAQLTELGADLDLQDGQGRRNQRGYQHG